MLNARQLLPLLLLSLVAAPACDEASVDDPYRGEPSPEEVFGADFRGWGYGESGARLNTNVVEGDNINTIRFGALSMYGSKISGIFNTITGEWLDMSTVEVVDGAIRGTTEGGVALDAFGFDESFWLVDVDGVDVVMILEEVRYASEVGLANYGSKMMTNIDPSRIVYRFNSYEAPAAGTKVDPKTGWGGTWDGTHTCATDPRGGAWSVMYRALLVNEATGDVSDANWAPKEYAYIACLSGRIGKTAMWGYAFDNPSVNRPDISLSEFEAAHRMVGAEYCGDGKSWTKPGEAVTIKDKWSINQFAGDPISEEAVWSKDGGALCVGSPRFEIYKAVNVICNGVALPTCSTEPQAQAKYNLAGAKWWTRNAWFED